MTKKRPRIDVDQATLQSLQEKNDKDEFSNFGKTVADTVRKLPRISQIQVKKKINDILFEAEMEIIKKACAGQEIQLAELF